MSKLGKELIAAMQEAVAHAKGKPVPGTKVHRVKVKRPKPAKKRGLPG